MEKKKIKKPTRNELACIAIDRYYTALDYLKYAGHDDGEIARLKRSRGDKAEAEMRQAVKTFTDLYGEPKAKDWFPLNVWQACQQTMNVLHFDRAWKLRLRSARAKDGTQARQSPVPAKNSS